MENISNWKEYDDIGTKTPKEYHYPHSQAAVSAVLGTASILSNKIYRWSRMYKIKSGTTWENIGHIEIGICCPMLYDTVSIYLRGKC